MSQMYTRLDAVGDAEERAESVAFKDRMRYKPFIEAAERFAADNGLIVGGPAATRLLLGDPENPAAPPPVALDSFQYDFYSGHAPAQARALGDAMYELDPEGLGHYVTVLTKVTGYYLSVAVDGRDLFTVTALPTHRGVKTADVVIPSYRPAQFAGSAGEPLKLACMGPEIQLMGLYAALCNPGKASTWGNLLVTEASLRALFRREIRAKIAEAVARTEARTGGRDPRRGRFFHALYDKFVSGADRVLIGPGALSLLRGEAPGEERVQVVTVSPLESEAREVAEIAKKEGLEVQWTTNDPKIPTDPRLRRLTIYLTEGRGARREPVMDIYNAAAHELVPYTTAGAVAPRRVTGGRRHRDRREARPPGHDRPRGPARPPAEWLPPATLKVGTPFVLMRFRLADMWTIQVLMRMGAVNPGYGKEVLQEMLADYETAAAYYEKVLAEAQTDTERAAARLLPQASYVGRLEEPDLALKRAALGRAGARFYPPYLPALKAERGEAEEPEAKV